MKKIKNVNVGDVKKINGKRYVVEEVYSYHIRVKEINPNSPIDKYDTFTLGDLVMNGIEDSGTRDICMEDIIEKYSA